MGISVNIFCTKLILLIIEFLFENFTKYSISKNYLKINALFEQIYAKMSLFDTAKHRNVHFKSFTIIHENNVEFHKFFEYFPFISLFF